VRRARYAIAAPTLSARLLAVGVPGKIGSPFAPVSLSRDRRESCPQGGHSADMPRGFPRFRRARGTLHGENEFSSSLSLSEPAQVANVSATMLDNANERHTAARSMIPPAPVNP
jgi:hypothetical protein